jgi:hypothetical protein
MTRIRKTMVRWAMVLPVTLFISLSTLSGGAEAQPPKSEVTKYTFDQSKIFPGTVRDYWVYVPSMSPTRQTTAARGRCEWTATDGSTWPHIWTSRSATRRAA